MKAVLVTFGILFLFIIWPIGLILLIIGLLMPSDKEIENENELERLKARVAELENISGVVDDTKISQDRVSLSKEEKLTVEYCEAYLELEEAREKSVVYHERKKLETKLDRLEKELKENNIDLDKDNIKKYYENYLSTIMKIEEGLD